MNPIFGKKYWALVTVLWIAVFSVGILIVTGNISLTGLVAAPIQPENGFGNPEASKKIDFYCNYQNYYCFAATKLVTEMTEKNSDLFFRFRQLPASRHPLDYNAAIASECAGLQGKFLEFHNGLIERNYDPSPQAIFEVASTLGPRFNQESFSQCVVTEETKDAVIGDLVDAQSNGITNAPSFVFDGNIFSSNNMDDLKTKLEGWNAS